MRPASDTKTPVCAPPALSSIRGCRVATVQSATEGEPRDPCTPSLPLPTLPDTPHPNTPTRPQGWEKLVKRALNVRIVGQNHSSSF